MIDMAQRLVIYRIDAGFEHQQALADAASLHVATISTAETGRPISLKSKRKIVNALRKRGIKVEIEDIDWQAK